MNPDAFAYTGLDVIEATIRKLATEANYLNLQDRTVRGADQAVGRFNFDASSAQPFLVPAANDAGTDDDAPADAFDDDDLLESLSPVNGTPIALAVPGATLPVLLAGTAGTATPLMPHFWPIAVIGDNGSGSVEWVEFDLYAGGRGV